VTFTAATTVSAHEIRDAIGSFIYLETDFAVTSFNTVDIDIPGLSVPVDANSRYLIDGWLAYESGTGAVDNPELRFGITAPKDTTGSWCIWSIVDNAGATSANLINLRRTDFNTGSALATEAGVGTGAGAAMGCAFTGIARIHLIGGFITARFAQLFSDTAATTVKAGSWIRVQKIAGNLTQDDL
jgi:hypothetical protein